MTETVNSKRAKYQHSKVVIEMIPDIIASRKRSMREGKWPIGFRGGGASDSRESKKTDSDEARRRVEYHVLRGCDFQSRVQCLAPQFPQALVIKTITAMLCQIGLKTWTSSDSHGDLV